MRLPVLGVVLCLLAAVFAVEAKLAWYSPHDPAQVAISANKLRASDAPELVAQVVASSATALACGVYLLLVVALAPLAAVQLRRGSLPDSIQPASSPGVFPPVFLRPPPRS